MSELQDLTKGERTEICRSIARAAHDCLATKESIDGCILGGSFQARLYKACSELSVISEVEFYGNSFSKERIEVLDGFEKTYSESLLLAAQYTELLCPLTQLEPKFAMPADALVRMWCVSHFSAALHDKDSPFANLKVVLIMCDDDVDDENDENDENAGSESESEDEDEDDEDDTIATSSDEEDDNNAESGSDVSDDDDGTAADADICAQLVCARDLSSEDHSSRSCKKARLANKKDKENENEDDWTLSLVKNIDEAFAEAPSDEE